MRRWPLVAAAAALCLAGCSTTSHPSASPATSAAVNAPSSATPSRTAPSSVINPDVIPPVITIPYVDAVFKVLEHIDGNVLRQLLQSRGITARITAELAAIYNQPLYSKEVAIAEQTLAGNMSNIIHPPGDVVMTVVRLISASPTCIFVATKANYDAVLKNPGKSPGSTYFALEMKQDYSGDRSLNSTPWSIFFNAVFLNQVTIPDQCAAR